MRAVIQRVSRASVSVDNQVCASIGKGLLILVAVQDDDNEQDILWLGDKILNLRIFDDKDGVMNLSVKDIHAELLVVSQFTLLASTKKGNRPSYIKASKAEISEPIYRKFLHSLSQKTDKEVKHGQFGADMQVDLCNIGPVTIIIDTKNKE